VRDGAEVYRATRDIAVSGLRTGRLVVDFDTIPDDRLWRFVRVRRGARITRSSTTSTSRTTAASRATVSALRAWWREYTRLAAPAPPAATDAIVARLVASDCSTSTRRRLAAVPGSKATEEHPPMKRLALTLLAAAAFAAPADAIPAFARKYHLTCMTCHDPIPRLTASASASRPRGSCSRRRTRPA